MIIKDVLGFIIFIVFTVMQSKVWYFYKVFPKQAASVHLIYMHKSLWEVSDP